MQVFYNNAGERVCVEWDDKNKEWEQSRRTPYSIVWDTMTFDEIGVKALFKHFGIAGYFEPGDLKKLEPNRLRRMGTCTDAA